MKTRIALILSASFAASLAHAAAPKSILINQAPVRAFLETKVINKARTAMKLTNVLDARDIGASKGVSQKAAEKARQAAYGLRNFGNGPAKNYVVKYGAKKLVVTRAIERDTLDMGIPTATRFIARDAKSGLVVARGNLFKGELTWTRMKNAHAASTPAERNAAE